MSLRALLFERIVKLPLSRRRVQVFTSPEYHPRCRIYAGREGHWGFDVARWGRRVMVFSWPGDAS